MRLHPSQIDQLLHPTIAENAKKQIIAKAGMEIQVGPSAFGSQTVGSSSDF